MAGRKRKTEFDLNQPLTWRSSPLDEGTVRTLAPYREYFGVLSDYETEIMRRILSYQIELKESNYEILAERLRQDQHHAFVYKNEWEAILPAGDDKGLRQRAAYRFIVIETIPGNERREERLIIDLNFQSQFAITSLDWPPYLNLWDSLPPIFIGTEEKLRDIIFIMCWAAEAPVPDHIKPEFLRFKWLSPNRRRHQ